MFLLRPPDEAVVARFLARQRDLPFSYSQVGWTRDGACPPGFRPMRFRTLLGHGPETFARARGALRGQAPFALGWLQSLTPKLPSQPGQTLVLGVRHLGFHSLIANRVVYLQDEPARFGFAYGTLPGHPEQGEERFLVTLAPGGAVRFELLAFSRPRHPLAVLGTPFVRALQGGALRGYLANMRRAVV